MNKPGPLVNREKLAVIGKYLDDALTLAGMTQSELARRADLRSSSYVSRVMKGERSVDRATLLKWCTILDAPEWLQELILNAAGYASERQRQTVQEERVVEETHRTILAEIERRGKGN